MKRGQGAAEFLLVTAIIISAIAVVLLPALKEAEFTLALAAARGGANSYASETGVELTSIDANAVGREVTITATAYGAQGGRLTNTTVLGRRMLDAIAKTVAPATGGPKGRCVQGVFNNYCVRG